MKGKKCYRILLSWLLVVVMTILTAIPVFAEPAEVAEDEKTGSFIVSLTEKDSGEGLSGNGFTLSSKTSDLSYSGETDEDGNCEFMDIPTGQYILTDTDPLPGYQTMSKQTVTVEEKVEKTLKVEKRKLAVTATLIIKTVDSEDETVLVGGIQFELYTDADELVDTITTSSAGTLSISDVKPGDYYLIQKTTTGDYVLDDERTEFSIEIPDGYTSWKETVVIRLSKESDTDHSQDLGEAHVVMRDKNTGKGIPDVGFTLYKAADDSVVKTFKTDDTGKFTAYYLPQDEYYFQITSLPDGYYFDTTATFDFELKYPVMEHTINLTAQMQQEMSEGVIEIYVKDEETKTPIENVSVTLTNSSDSVLGGDAQTTDENGLIRYEGVPFGVYKAKMTSVPDEYPLSQSTYTIDLKQSKPKYTFELLLTKKENLTGTLNLTVVDQDTNKAISGASFKLYKADGTFVKDVTVGTTGVATEQKLPMGSYYLTEAFMPNGYQLNDTKKYEFKFEGQILVANITIKKPFGTVAESGTLNILVVDQDDNSKPVVGATLSLLKGVDGPIFATYKTDSEGKISVKNIPLSTYWISESTMPYGYTISKNKTEVQFTASKPIYNIKFQKLYRDPENGGSGGSGGSGGGTGGNENPEQKTGAINVTVVDKTTQNPIPGAVLEFYDDNDTLIKEITTDETGLASVTELTLGKYYFTEKTMPKGYTPSLEKHQVDLEKFNVYNIKLQKLKAGDSGSGDGQQEKGTLSVVFKDKASQNPIAGVSVELHKSTGELVGASTTKEDGTATYTALKFGDYYFVETAVPAEYSVNTEKRAVSVSQEIPSFTLTVNKQKSGTSGGGQTNVKGKISITVINPKTNTRISGAVLALYDAATNTKVKAYTSDSNGKIEITDLELKTYYLKEESMPGKYILDADSEYTIPLSKDINTYTFTLQKYEQASTDSTKPAVTTGTYILNVLDSTADSIKVNGAAFALYKEDGTKVASYTTDSNGNITIKNLAFGKYYMQEESMPGRYILSQEKYSFELSKDCVNFTMTIRKAKSSSSSSGGSSSGGGGGHSSSGGGGGGSSKGSSSSSSSSGTGPAAGQGSGSISKPDFTKTAVTGGSWKQEADGRWWYQFSQNTYPKNSWECIPSGGRNLWYYFDGKGYMQTGWIKDSGDNWYFLNSDGSMAMNTWYYDGTNWFYMNNEGKMQTGWIYVDNNWFYLNPVSDGTKGAMRTGWIYVDNNWFYLNPISDGTKGAMKTGHQVINGKEYYFNEVSDGTRGAMK